MTLPEALDLLKYWRKHPPAHLLLAALARFKPKEETEDFAPATRISPVAPGVNVVPIRRSTRQGTSIATALAMTKGGEVSLAALQGMAS